MTPPLPQNKKKTGIFRFPKNAAVQVSGKVWIKDVVSGTEKKIEKILRTKLIQELNVE